MVHAGLQMRPVAATVVRTKWLQWLFQQSLPCIHSFACVCWLWATIYLLVMSQCIYFLWATMYLLFSIKVKKFRKSSRFQALCQWLTAVQWLACLTHHPQVCLLGFLKLFSGSQRRYWFSCFAIIGMSFVFYFSSVLLISSGPFKSTWASRQWLLELFLH